MEVKRLRILIVEIFKTLHDSNPIFIKDIFHYCQNKSHKKHNLHVHRRSTSGYGNNSLHVLGVHIWNSLPENIKCKDSAQEPPERMARPQAPSRTTNHRHPSRIHKEKDTAAGGPPDLIRLLETVYAFFNYHFIFLLAFTCILL